MGTKETKGIHEFEDHQEAQRSEETKRICTGPTADAGHPGATGSTGIKKQRISWTTRSLCNCVVQNSVP